jgi:3-hydroxy-9,10-secoandrosta-1,3,5(10)-triene-9,17-dione monooxygenase
MTVNLHNPLPLNLDTDIKRIVNVFSEADREEFTSDLLEAIRSSHVIKILDENQDAGPGTLRDVLQVCQNLGKVDTSLAWIVGVSNSAWSTKSCFHSLDSSVLTSMERNKILAMVLGRPGSLKRNKTSGNYLLTGQWRYASGWRYSSFFFCLAGVEGADTSDMRMVAVPSKLLEVTEDWQATGLRGSQSVTVRAHDIEIEESNMEDYFRILSGKHHIQNKSNDDEKHTSYSGLFTGVLMSCLLGSILGATEAGLEYVASVVSKYPVAGSTYTLMRDSGAIRAEIGRLRSTLDLYKRAAEYNADVIDKIAREPDIILTSQDRVDNRARATQVMRGCVNIVQDLLWIYGSSGLDRGNPLERIWRDVNIGARHGGFSKFVPEEAVGLAFIGQDPKELTQMF